MDRLIRKLGAEQAAKSTSSVTSFFKATDKPVDEPTKKEQAQQQQKSRRVRLMASDSEDEEAHPGQEQMDQTQIFAQDQAERPDGLDSTMDTEAPGASADAASPAQVRIRRSF